MGFEKVASVAAVGQKLVWVAVTGWAVDVVAGRVWGAGSAGRGCCNEGKD